MLRAMSCVWCSQGRWGWSYHGLRSIGISALITTLLIMLTTNLYFLNGTYHDENGQLTLDKAEPTHTRICAGEDGVKSQVKTGNDGSRLLNKLEYLKVQMEKTRTRISAHKENLNRIIKMGQNLESSNPPDNNNNLKRRLMNADKSFVPTSDQKRYLEDVVKSTFLKEENLFSKINESSSFLSCQDLPQNPDVLENIGSGYTKQVHKANIGGKYVALKQANRRGHDGLECAQYGMSQSDCYRLANYKVLKELALLQQLKSPHVIKLLGYCLRDDKREEDATPTVTMVTIATEYGEPLTFITLLQMSWEDRLRIAFGITKLLVHLQNSPMGALTMHDFKLTQFVLTNNEIQLADLDDVDDADKICREDDDCRIGNVSNQPCVQGLCKNYSDRINVYHAHKLFYSLLPFEAPASVQQRVAHLTNSTAQSNWNSSHILESLDDILQMYRNSYIHGSSHITDNKFNVFPDRDFPALHDYWCHGTIYAGADSCAFSVRNEDEAKYICNRDPRCKAFVMTSQKTWTGRTVAYLKNNSNESIPTSKGNTLYVRIT